MYSDDITLKQKALLLLPHTELYDDDANRAPDDGAIRATDDGAIGGADDDATDDGDTCAIEATTAAAEGRASNQLEAWTFAAVPPAVAPPAAVPPADFMTTSVECCATNFYPGKFGVV